MAEVTRVSSPPEGKPAKVPYWRYAFHNPYNYTLLGGVAAAATLTGNWWLAVAGAGAEALWMVFGPDSRLLRKLWFDKVHDQNLAEVAATRRAALLGSLPSDDVERITSLEQKRADILRLAAENRALTADLLRGELGKLDQLVASFVDLLTSTRRFEQYLEELDFEGLERDARRYERTVEKSKDDDERKLAQKNLAILLKRRERIEEIHQFVTKARGQMDLIENTFMLLGDQIVTMRSPTELGGQLDELMDGVEAVKTTAREADGLLEATTR